MFTIKRHDLAPAFKSRLRSDGLPVDLTGCNVRFLMSLSPSVTPLVTATAFIEDAVGGLVSYGWSPGETDVEGEYQAEWEVTFPNGNVRTFPSSGYEVIHIVPDLGLVGQNGIPRWVAGHVGFVAAPAGAIVGTTDTQTLIHKTIDGNDNTFRNVPASAITGAVSSGFVGLDDPQTLTHKTLDGNDNTFANIPTAALSGVTEIVRAFLEEPNSFLLQLAIDDHTGGDTTGSGELVFQDAPVLNNPTITVAGAAEGEILVVAGGTLVRRYATPPGVPAPKIPLRADLVPGAPRNAREVFERLSTYDARPIYVASWGLDANPGTLSAPTTVNAALKTYKTGSHIICLDDMVIDTIDLRYTDATQTGAAYPKLLDANGHNVVMKIAGPDLKSKTYTNDGTFTHCWTTSLSELTSLSSMHRLLRTDVRDDYGYAQPFRKYASVAALDAGTGDDGFFYDTSGKVLWIRLANNASVQANRGILRGLFTKIDGFARSLVYGAPLCLSGVRFEGVQCFMLDGGGVLPQLYLHDCLSLWAHQKGVDLNFCGVGVVSDTTVYASEFDCLNALQTSAVAKGYVQTVNSRFIRPGDMRTFPANGTLQGASVHGGSNHISFGCTYIEANGQAIADTNIDNSTDYSWIVDAHAEGGWSSSNTLDFGGTGTNSMRNVYLDNVRAYRRTTGHDLGAGNTSRVRVYQSTLEHSAGQNANIVPYLPGVF